MKPCSAYCRPEENRHTFLDYAKNELTARSVLGRVGRIEPGVGVTCLPDESEFLVLQVEPAIEAPPTSDERCSYAVLLTVEVLP